LELDSEAKWVSMAVDMALAQRAEVFVGNGVSCLYLFIYVTNDDLVQFSSLTSNDVLLRMAQGMEAESNRFWR